jgi:hypothetical protein
MGTFGSVEQTLPTRTGLGWRIQREPWYVSPQRFQPQREPASFETGMSGKGNPASIPERSVRHEPLLFAVSVLCFAIHVLLLN